MSVASALARQNSLKALGNLDKTSLLDSVLTPLRTAGYILDVPGSFARGVISGNYDRALSGIFDPSKRVSGTELLGGSKDKFTWGGLGAELALDPLNAVSFGTLTGAGKLASRAGKLEDSLKAVKAFSNPNLERLASIEKALAEVTAKQEALGTAGRLGSTVREQVKLGQRSGFALDIPFTNIHEPLTSGATLPYVTESLAKLSKLPGVSNTLSTVNRIFNPNYLPEAGRSLTSLEKAFKNESRIRINRLPEITGSNVQREIAKDIDDLAKLTGKSRQQVELDLIQEIESIPYQKYALGEASPLPNTPTTYVSDLAKKVEGIYTDLLREGQDELSLSPLGSNLGYYQRTLTPQALEYLRKAKKNKGLSDKLQKVLIGGSPSFTEARRLFPEAPLKAINDAVKKKLKVDFDFFSTDVASSLGFRAKKQTEAVALGHIDEAFTKLFGQKKGKGLVDASSFISESPRTKFITDKLERFRPRKIKDEAGKTLVEPTQEDMLKALDTLKTIRGIERSSNVSGIDHLVDLSKSDVLETNWGEVEKAFIPEALIQGSAFKVSFEDALKDLAVDASTLILNDDDAKFVKDILSRHSSVSNPQEYFKRLTDFLQDLGDPKKLDQLPEILNDHLKSFLKSKVNTKSFKNKLYHGTSTENVLRILDEGLQATVPSPNWGSTQILDFEKGKGSAATFFSPSEASADSYAYGAAKRVPGNPEKNPGDFFKYVKDNLDNKFNIQFRSETGPYDIALSHVLKRYGARPGYLSQDLLRNKATVNGIPIADEATAIDVEKQILSFIPQPVTLQTKLSDLITSGSDPVLDNLLASYEKGKPFGIYDKKVLPEDLLNKVSGHSDDTNEAQIMAGSVKPAALRIKDFESKWSRLEGRMTNEARQNIVARWNRDASRTEISKALKDAGLTERYLGKDQVELVRKLKSVVRDPEVASGFLKLVDNVNAAYRGLLTAVFPAYHVRNGMSGIFMNILGGVTDPRYYERSVKQLPKLTQEQSTYLKSLGVLGKGKHEETLGMIARSDIGRKQLFKKPLNLGYRAGQAVDDLNRYAMYLAKKAKGLSDTEAAEQVIKYHFDYDDITDVERLGLRRGVLFYTFVRKNIPLMLQSLAENPRVMQLYNRAVGGTNPNINEPHWLNDAFFGPDGKRISLGLPPEDLVRYGTDGKGLQRLGQIITSELFPAIPAAVETLSGRNLYFDRPIEGSLPKRILEQSPLSRFYGTFDRASKNPGQEAVRVLSGLNIKTFDDKEIIRQNQIASVKRLLEQLNKQGKARKFEVYSGEDERVKELNSILNRLYQDK